MFRRPIFQHNLIDDPFTMDTWDPLFDKHTPFHHRHGKPGPFGGEWEETAEAQVLRVDIPAGMKREELKVEVKEGKTVTISGRKSAEREERNEKWHHFERSKRNFLRVVTLPENCKVDQVRSHLEHGVLTVTVPKMDPLLNKSHAIKQVHVDG